ncbi:hypothetical protein [Naasia sp. SYSU D00948]|uniref:hypothetical protein n=1 Tax=Naasia sp. SYSU D00948 TaxID=2817379 RepID=UPI001B30111D|nr:hypothetical protein [Naasia sp. SYSU D00948]
MTRERNDGRGYWAVLLVRGILAAVLALVITFSADHNPVFGMAVYGAFAFLQGLLLATTASRSASTQIGAALTLAAGVVGIATGVLAGALLAVSPGAAAEALVPAVALSAAASGLLELLLGLRRADAGAEARDRVVLGIVTLVLAVTVLVAAGNPVVTVGLVGAYGAVAGVYLIIAALSLLWSGPNGASAPDAEEVSRA